MGRSASHGCKNLDCSLGITHRAQVFAQRLVGSCRISLHPPAELQRRSSPSDRIRAIFPECRPNLSKRVLVEALRANPVKCLPNRAPEQVRMMQLHFGLRPGEHAPSNPHCAGPLGSIHTLTGVRFGAKGASQQAVPRPTPMATGHVHTAEHLPRPQRNAGVRSHHSLTIRSALEGTPSSPLQKGPAFSGRGTVKDVLSSRPSACGDYDLRVLLTCLASALSRRAQVSAAAYMPLPL